MEEKMSKKDSIQVFEDKQVRTLWDADQEKWYLSVVDVIEILTGTDRPRKYWSDLKAKLKKEGSELSEKIGQLKMQSSDGKYYKTDVLNTKGVLRLVQSIPSPKAEPFKTWLAHKPPKKDTNEAVYMHYSDEYQLKEILKFDYDLGDKKTSE